MTQQELELAKAKAKTLAHHFSKVAAHHEHKAAAHEKMAEAHHAHADHHKEMAEKMDGDHKAHHKAQAAFHKTKAAHHEKMHKLHKAMHEHHSAMADAHEAGEASKVYKAVGIEEEPLSTRPVTPAPAAAAPAPAAAAPAETSLNKGAETAAPAAPASTDVNDTIQKALDTKLTEAVSAAFERVLNSGDFSKKVDDAIAAKLLEKLGSSTVPGEIRTFPVPRPGQAPAAPVAKGVPDTTGLDPELAQFVEV